MLKEAGLTASEADKLQELPETPRPDEAVFGGCTSRPNNQFQLLCHLAGVKPKQDVETGAEKPWVLKDLRKTCATYYDEHMPESSIEILGHSVGDVTYRHYAHRDPLAFKAIMTLPQELAAMGVGSKTRPGISFDKFGDKGRR